MVAERYTVDDLLADAHRRIERLTPHALSAAIRQGTTVIDTRSRRYLRSEGFIKDSVHVPLSVLPWRADPNGGATDSRINKLNAPLAIVCNDGYSSGWVGAVLVDLGFTKVADLIGGHRAWVDAGLPVEYKT